MAQVVLKQVNKIYPNGFHAVRDQSLEIHDGEFMVFVGPSGCAKSTTLNMIAGLEEITSGEIWIGDRLVNNLPPKDRDIAMVFQSYALYPHMSVRQNMAFGLRLQKKSKQEIDRRVNEASEILGITDLLGKRPKELSGGQRQRVAVGRAIVRKPRVFLFDEPLSNLDAKLRVHMRVELAKLHQELGTTVVYVTHDQTEAMTMGQRITVMKAGVIQQVDSPVDLYERPANRFVAGFIGSPAMNIVEAVLRQEGARTFCLLPDGQSLVLPPPMAAKAAAHNGRKVLFGIRPEHIHTADDMARSGTVAAPSNCLQAETYLVEHMGNEDFVYFTLGGERLLARMRPARSTAPGGLLDLWVDAERGHLFDPQSGETIVNGIPVQP